MVRAEVFFCGNASDPRELFSESSAFSGNDCWNPVGHLKVLSDHKDTLCTSRVLPFLLPALLYTTFGFFRTLRATLPSLQDFLAQEWESTSTRQGALTRLQLVDFSLDRPVPGGEG